MVPFLKVVYEPFGFRLLKIFHPLGWASSDGLLHTKMEQYPAPKWYVVLCAECLDLTVSSDV